MPQTRNELLFRVSFIVLTILLCFSLVLFIVLFLGLLVCCCLWCCIFGGWGVKLLIKQRSILMKIKIEFI